MVFIYKYILLIIFWFVLLGSYFWLHEFAGHYLAGLLSGISPNQMEIIWITYNNIKILPEGVTILEGEIPKILPFAGGFMAGLLLFILSIFVFLRLYRKKKQELLWWLFTITLGYSGVGFTEFIIEGLFIDYHRGGLETPILAFFAFLFPPLLSAWHYRNRILDWYKAI